MNANEIASQLERDVKDFFPIPDEICLKAISMLREQQQQIVLIEENSDYWADKHSGLIKEHRQQQEDKQMALETIKCHEQTIAQQQAEIEALHKEREGLCVFCENRAILRKAQEK